MTTENWKDINIKDSHVTIHNPKPANLNLIFDDVQDYQDVKPCLPPADPRFKVLLTSRKKFGKPVITLNLDVLSPATALDLLKAIVGEERIEAELEVAQELCGWLGYLPLGLELTGHYLDADPDLSLAEVFQELQEESLTAEALKTPKDSILTAEEGVQAAFQLSWKRLNKNSRSVGYLFSLFAIAPISWLLVEKIALKEESREWKLPKNGKKLKEGRKELILFHLIKRKEKETYEVHSLTREFLRLKVEKLEWGSHLKRGFCEIMAAIGKEIPDTATIQDIEAVAPHIPHLAETATFYQNWLQDDDLIEPLSTTFDRTRWRSPPSLTYKPWCCWVSFLNPTYGCSSFSCCDLS